MLSRGAVSLRKSLRARGAKSALAVEFNVGPHVVSRWLSGTRKPTPAQRIELRQKFKIPYPSWDFPPEEDASSGKENAA